MAQGPAFAHIPPNARSVTGMVFGPNHEKNNPLPVADSLAYKRWGIGVDFAVICNRLARDPQWTQTRSDMKQGPAHYENFCQNFYASRKLMIYKLCFIGSTRVTSEIFICQRGLPEEAEWERKLAFAFYDKSSKKWIDKEAKVEITREYTMDQPATVKYSVSRIGRGL